MKIDGSYTLGASREDVWEALHDPSVLARTLPGCQALEVTGDDRYAVTVRAGVASIKGTYQGSITLAEKTPPERYVMDASGQGGPGTIDARVAVELVEVDGGTRVDYDVDATVGGTIAGVGQRVLQGASKKTAQEFFTAVERELSGEGPVPEAAEEAAADVPGRARTGEVFRPAARPEPAIDAAKLLVAAALGAAIALIGVLVGRRLDR
ncbi:MAG: carbon monoxide dehydrogenase subunit G [Nitriliruptorales bacterium]|nr:carbon monoxide dehydrogenase subunit G [Nitriliruptorales bacterium]